MIYALIVLPIAIRIWWKKRSHRKGFKNHFHNGLKLALALFVSALVTALFYGFVGGIAGVCIPVEWHLDNTYTPLLIDSQHQECIIQDNGLKLLSATDDSDSIDVTFRYTEQKPYVKKYTAYYDENWKYLFAFPKGFDNKTAYKIYTNGEGLE